MPRPRIRSLERLHQPWLLGRVILREAGRGLYQPSLERGVGLTFARLRPEPVPEQEGMSPGRPVDLTHLDVHDPTGVGAAVEIAVRGEVVTL